MKLRTALTICMILMIIADTIVLSGCDIPDVPNGAACSPEGWVMKLSDDADPLDYRTWEFVVDSNGAAMQCHFE